MGQADKTGESKLRGGALDGSNQSTAPDNSSYRNKSDPDAVLRTDGEQDTLYDDALDLEDDSKPLSSTDGADDSSK